MGSKKPQPCPGPRDPNAPTGPPPPNPHYASSPGYYPRYDDPNRPAVLPGSTGPPTCPPFIREVVRDWLMTEMSEISEETVCASWEAGLEFRLWEAVQSLPEPHVYSGRIVSAERIERLRDVSEWLGEWMVWRDLEGITPVPLGVWKQQVKDNQCNS